ncbi:MAG TPA: hypothetical protein VIR30_09445 [Nocardioides sp.]
MELIAIEMAELTRRSRSILLNHSDLALDRGLDPGERVVLWDSISGDYHSGQVLDVDFTLEDTTYRFKIGIRLPDELALARLTGVASAGHQITTQQVIELLDSLRVDAPVASSGALRGFAQN